MYKSVASINKANKSCVVIGTTRLCLTILDELQTRDWTILGVISTDEAVQEYCNARKINLYKSFDELSESSYILFSVANYQIIPEACLQKENVMLAINYHDSLLPQYAGVNSTTWAIVNAEKKHGVTWHIITAGIDEGGILKQASLDISPTETAQSLNFRCFELAIHTFKSLLSDIETDNICVKKQVLTQRSYYGKGMLPDNYGLITYTDCFEKTDRLFRSLQIGTRGTANTVATCKIWDGQNAYIVNSLHFTVKENTVPGYVYAINENNCLIGIKDGLLHIGNVLKLDGTPISFSETRFRKNDKIASLTFHNATLKQMTSAKKREGELLKVYKSEAHESGLFFIKPVLHSSDDQLIHEFSKTLSIESDEKETIVTKIMMVLLSFMTHNICLPVRKHSPCISDKFSKFFRQEAYLPLATTDRKLSFAAFQERIVNILSESYYVPNDFQYRYGINNTSHDIVIDLCPDGEQIFEKTNRLHIAVYSQKIIFLGNSQDKTIVESLAASISHVIGMQLPSDKTYLYGINVIPQAAHHKIIHEWNSTARPYPGNKTIHDLFTETATKIPNKIAVICNNQSITYKELEQQSNQLARYIRKQYHSLAGDELPPETLVPICLERSIEMIISLLAICKTGAAYVPIDPNLPEQRIAYIIEDTQCKLVLTEEALAKNKFKNINIPTICLNEIESNETLSYHSLNLTIKPSHLVYVTYTSGTTGTPKGVMIEHASLVNTIWGLSDVYDFSEDRNKTCCYTSLIFDVSASEIYTSLLRGGELHFLDDTLRQSPELLSNYILQNEINYIYLPPAVLALLPKSEYPSLRTIVFAGEPCDQKVGEYWAANYKLYNYYGPTECTIYATGKQVDKRDVNEIGKPISNKKAYILDKYMKPVPVGVIGELYIGGEGNARGYWQQPELTSKQFILSKNLDEGMLYKTGDLVRWLPDGNIQYIGRNDFQVKIRGQRVELGEVEKVISGYPAIEQSVILVKSKQQENATPINDKQLVVFFKARGDIDIGDLKHYLTERLPDYMVPRLYKQLDAFPTTLSGKLDRHKLLSIELAKPKMCVQASRTTLEQKIHAIWCTILSRGSIDIDENFFEAGGDSLKAMDLQIQLQKELLCDCTIVTLFQYPTIRLFANFVTQNSVDVNNDTVSQVTSGSKLSDSKDSADDIAIIGMACRVPGANSPDELWNNLKNSRESIVTPSDEEFPSHKAKNYVNRAGNISDYYGFDAKFFGFSSREADSIDPQHRHFMEIVYEALEEAGYSSNQQAKKIGLYAGQGEQTYYVEHVLGDEECLNNLGRYQISINNSPDFLTTKVSYKLDLKGPSLNIQTACSTSLVAVHVAISQLKSGECDIAVAGGISLADRKGYQYKKGMILSKDGHCRPFDAIAGGTVLSSGAGVVVLKPLVRALADGDHIHAVIKGSAINNDGGSQSKVGYTAPSANGQAEIINEAIEVARIDPTTITYIETHGTGTKLGDPIEIAGLHQVFAKYQPAIHSIALGSIKSNIGHTDAAAGILGLIKTCLALKHKQIPASLHFKQWNPEIAVFNQYFYVNNALTDWKTTNDLPRRAGVSSFGIGGTNVHLIAEEAPCRQPQKTDKPAHLFVFSAESRYSLNSYQLKFNAFINQMTRDNFGAVSYTLRARRKHRTYRCFAILSNKDNNSEPLSYSEIDTATSPQVILMFPGQGTQFKNMAKELYDESPIFRNQLDECFIIFDELTQQDLKSIIFSESIAEDILHQTRYAQPALFSISYSLAKLYIQLGIQPAAMIGHSLGEYVAATLANVFSLKDALSIVVLRGELMQSMEPGAMLYLNYPVSQVIALIPYQLDIAAINSPTLSVVSGNSDDINEFSKYLTSKKIKHGMVQTSHAFHSRMMQPMLDAYKKHIDEFSLSAPKFPIISCLTGGILTPEEAQSSQYWCNHILKPVQFWQGIQTLEDAYKNVIFLEVGVGNTLRSFVSEISDRKTLSTLGHIKYQTNTYEHFLRSIGQLWQHGLVLDWSVLDNHETNVTISLPAYAFEHHDYCVKKRKSVKKTSSSMPSSKTSMSSDTVGKLQKICSEILGIDKVSSDNNFFELGGSSLLAVQFLAKIESFFQIDLDISSIYQCQTLTDLAETINTAVTKINFSDSEVDALENITETSFATSPQQQALWTLQNVHGGQYSAYNESLLFKIEGEFNDEVFSNSLQILQRRHESLRTIFLCDSSGELVQKILTDMVIDFKLVECVRESLDNLIKDFSQKTFDLESGPLIRARCFKVKNSEYIIMLVFHHIIIDGSSLRTFCNELNELYNAAINHEKPTFSTKAKPYAHYVDFYHNFVNTKNYDKKITFWKERLSGYQPIKLSQRIIANTNSFMGARYYFWINENLSKKIKILATKNRTTLFNLFLAALNILLHKCFSVEDIVVGSPMLNRPSNDFQHTMGLFTNTVALRNFVEKQLTFTEFLEQVSQRTFQAYRNQEVPFEQINSLFRPNSGTVQDSLVQVLLLVLNQIDLPMLNFARAVSEPHDMPDIANVKFDLSLVVVDQESQIKCYFEYATSKFNKDYIQCLSEYVQTLLSNIVKFCDKPIESLAVLSENSMRKMLLDWNPRYEKKNFHTTLHEMFSKNAARHGEKTALKFGDQLMSYRELDKQSTQLAHYLEELLLNKKENNHQKSEIFIAVCLEPSFQTIVAILAVLKLGAAYVPIDANYPLGRIQHILSDSQASLIISQHSTLNKVALDKNSNEHVVVDDKAVCEKIASKTCSPIASDCSESHRAYIIYTSGSTGKPKGVSIPHKNVLALFDAASEHFTFDQTDTWLLFHSFAFDVSVWEIWGALLHGGTLVIIPYSITRDPYTFYQLTIDNHVTVLNQTPSAFRNYIDADIKASTKISSLHTVIFAGEALDIEMLRDWWQSHKDTEPQLVNMYGITETTIHSTYQALYECHLDKFQHGKIGAPLKHLRAYVLDELMNPVPVGVPGELYIGGEGVADGYLKRPELTTQRFIKDPFAAMLGLGNSSIIYRSGDQVTWSSDGMLNYIGRIDFQVKLRGFRIELGEIESVILKLPEVSKCVVLLRDEGQGAYLACYYTSNANKQTISDEEIRTFAAAVLPDYMIPTAFVALQAIPMTVNGKVDRRSLPTPVITKTKEHYVAPSNELEQQIVKKWSEILSINADVISIDDDYFKLGGTSLSVIKMLTAVNQLTGVNMSLSGFWKAPTVRSIARVGLSENDDSSSYINKILERLQVDCILPEHIQPTVPFRKTQPPKAVFVTGATGFLGIHLINELEQLDNICIYCLVRGASAKDASLKLQTMFVESQLNHLVKSSKIKVICGDLGVERFGLTEAVYTELAEEVDAIYLVGANVHHIHDYFHLYAENVLSTKTAINLAVHKKDKAIHYVSTISIKDFDVSHKLSAASPIWTWVELNGYLLTKWCSEQLIQSAIKRGINAKIYRPGNITGHSKTGYCNPDKNHTLLKVKGFLQLQKAFYATNEAFEMVPVDIIANEIVIKSMKQQPQHVFNLDNPVKIAFSHYLKYFVNLNELERVDSFEDWKKCISELDESNALFPLKVFYEHYDSFLSWKISDDYSKDLHSAVPEYSYLIASQINYLKKIGFLTTSSSSKFENQKERIETV